jgi:hypothetical protein
MSGPIQPSRIFSIGLAELSRDINEPSWSIISGGPLNPTFYRFSSSKIYAYSQRQQSKDFIITVLNGVSITLNSMEE